MTEPTPTNLDGNDAEDGLPLASGDSHELVLSAPRGHLAAFLLDEAMIDVLPFYRYEIHDENGLVFDGETDERGYLHHPDVPADYYKLVVNGEEYLIPTCGNDDHPYQIRVIGEAADEVDEEVREIDEAGEQVEVIPSVYFATQQLPFKVTLGEQPESITSLTVGGNALAADTDYFYHEGVLYFSPRSLEGDEVSGELRFPGEAGEVARAVLLTRTEDPTAALDSLERQVENFEAMAQAMIARARDRGDSAQAIEYLQNGLDDHLWDQRRAALDDIEERAEGLAEVEDLPDRLNRIGGKTIVD